MSYLLDTDTIVALLRGDRSIADRIKEVGAQQIWTTAINLAELYYGAFNSAKVDENMETVDRFRRAARVVDFDGRAAVLFGRTKAHLKREGRRLDDSDLMIAAVALATQTVLVTNNIRHFSRVPELALESWMRE